MEQQINQPGSKDNLQKFTDLIVCIVMNGIIFHIIASLGLFYTYKLRHLPFGTRELLAFFH